MDEYKKIGLFNYKPPEIPNVGGPLSLGIAGAGGKSKKNIRINLNARGAPKNKKLSDQQIFSALEDHGFRVEYHDNGGVTAYEVLSIDRQQNPVYRKKYFKPNTTIETLRSWLGY